MKSFLTILAVPMLLLLAGCNLGDTGEEISKQVEEVKSVGDSLVDGAEKIKTGELASIKEGADQIVESGKAIGDKGNSALDATKGLLGQIGDATEGAIESVENVAGTVAESAADGVAVVGETLDNAGEAVVDGAGTLATEAGEALDGAQEAVTEAVVRDEPASESVTLSTYTEYSEEKLNDLYGQKTIVNFRADWCPTCAKLEDKLEDPKNAEMLSGVNMLLADYDQETALKQKYGVTAQTTLVFLDEQHNVVKSERNPDLETIAGFFN